MNISNDENSQFLTEMARTRMPFGKYQGRLLVDLPEPYVVWFKQKGFPGGKLGRMLGILYEIKVNGLEYLLRKVNQNAGEDNAQES
mgnify:CR=1 FL=1